MGEFALGLALALVLELWRFSSLEGWAVGGGYGCSVLSTWKGK